MIILIFLQSYYGRLNVAVAHQLEELSIPTGMHLLHNALLDLDPIIHFMRVSVIPQQKTQGGQAEVP